jgi:hypothetical protein
MIIDVFFIRMELVREKSYIAYFVMADMNNANG